MARQRIIEFMGIRLIINDFVYEPSDDTELLAQVVLNRVAPNLSVLEIGCGSGAISILLAKKGCHVTATDINPIAVEMARKNAEMNHVKINFYVGDLFAGLRKTFDVVIFNPPYLPEDDYDFLINKYYRLALIGGKKGNEVIIGFLRGLPNHLKPGGVSYLVLSTLSDIDEIFRYMESLNFSYEIIASKSFFFEEIFVVEIKLNQARWSTNQLRAQDSGI